MQHLYITTPSTLTVLVSGVPHSIDDKHPSYIKLLDIVTKGVEISDEEIISMMRPVERLKFILKKSKTMFTIDKGVLTCTLDNETVQLPDMLRKEIVRIYEASGNLFPLHNFVRKSLKNPNKDAINELYEFIAVCGLVITESGNFMAYKSVTNDFKDHHTRKMDNSPGAVVKMPRATVDADRHTTCSIGLHFAAWEYAKDFGRDKKLVILEINPKHVVAIPSDYNNQKGRACKYRIVREITKDDELKGTAVWKESDVPSIDEDPDDESSSETTTSEDFWSLFASSEQSCIPSELQHDTMVEILRVDGGTWIAPASRASWNVSSKSSLAITHYRIV